MPSSRAHTSFNPTVEDVWDEPDGINTDTATDPCFSWPEICAQHENVLSSHLKMLQTVKGQVSSDADASRLISSMLERTNKLALQFDGVKSRIIPRVNKGYDSTRMPPGDLNDSGRPAPSRSDEGVVRPKRRKRQRISNEVEQESVAREPLLAEVQRMKRKRVDVALSGHNEDVLNAMPVAMETEDISDEVQRRLKIKDEQRRNRDSKPEKRKRDRDSLASNASTSSLGNTKKPRKKFKLSEQVNR
ncbi:hypothetical protein BDV12DRAFT_194761 [Aspergillus spectabilis]